MKRNFKITIAALSAMLVMALAVSVISFSFAGNKNQVATLTDADLEQIAAENAVTKSVIDYIIENSYLTKDEENNIDPVYHIVEVGSSSTPSGLKDFCENGGFGTYVIDGNRSDTVNGKVLNPAIKAIDYTYIEGPTVGNKTDNNADTNAALTKVANADFIYVSNDKTSAATEYSKTRDLSEDMYQALHSYADTKPLIIDSPSKGGDDISDDDTLTMQKLAEKVFGVSGMYYYTFSWDQSRQTADEFLQHNRGSLYLGIRGTRVQGNWETYARSDESAEAPYTVAKFLAVSTDGTTTTMAESLLNCPIDNTSILVSGTPLEVYDISDVNNDYANPSVMYQFGYNGRYVRPDFVKLETVKLADIESYDLSKYDMVIYEQNCNTATISSAIYKKLAAAMYANISMVYDSGMGTGVVVDPDDPGDTQETNFKELFYMVATVKEKPKTENVMVTTRSKLSIILESNSAETCKVIADIINKSQFRTIGGRNSSSDKFTVLEIQPCYPIDLELANKIGQTTPRSKTSDKATILDVFGNDNYYIDPANIENNKTKEEIEGDTEYYAWELSPAKVVDAIDSLHSVDEVNVVHMSTEELAGSKTELLGTYDMIYIGGNFSALKDAGQFQSLIGISGWGKALAYHNIQNINMLPVYTMYSHGGDFVPVGVMESAAGESGGSVKGGEALSTVYINGQKKTTFQVLNGNDITYNKRVELEKYIDAGMPVIVNSQLADGYQAKFDFGYKQNSIDPDSNMCKVLDKLYANKDKKTNIAWDFDYKGTVHKDNDGGNLGATNTGYVVVYAKSTGEYDVEGGTELRRGEAERINELYLASKKRPKLVLTGAPTEYNSYDITSRLTNGELNFSYDVAGTSSYEVRLYIDDDGNSSFTDGSNGTANEIVATSTSTKLKYSTAKSFFGPIYWKIELYDKTSKTKCSKTGLSYIQPKTDEKQTIRVLQVLPSGKSVDGPQGQASLYFCTVCNQVYDVMEYNAYNNAPDGTPASESYGAMYGGNYDECTNGMLNGYYVGKHEHTFGIVKYDSSLTISKNGNLVYGRDDWYVNLADEVSDLYEFELDIMYRDEFEAISKNVHSVYDGKTAEQKEALVAQYKQEQSDKSQAYDAAKKEADLREEVLKLYLKQMIDNVPAAYANGKRFGGASQDALIKEFNRLITKGVYSDYYSIQGRQATYDANIGTYYINSDVTYKGVTYTYTNFNDVYKWFIEANDKQVEAKKELNEATRLVDPDDWIYGCYDTVILGPAEDFAGDDIKSETALNDLEVYLNGDGQLLLFHDTLSRMNNNGSSELTKRLIAYFGQDRYHMIQDTETMSSLIPDKANWDSFVYVPYKLGTIPYRLGKDEEEVEVISAHDKDKYYMMNLSSTHDIDDKDKYLTWSNEMNSIHGAVFGQWGAKMYLASLAYSDSLMSAGHTSGSICAPYRFADYTWKTASFWQNDAGFNVKDNPDFGTNKAQQNNKGIVTQFPFTLSENLNISGTHSQAFAVDLEDEDLTVWYSLAGGSGAKAATTSSFFAATPKDAMDNYFVYSYHNVYYCGAGHSNVCGIGKDNNDERMLYINIICNSVRKSIKQPSIYVYDYKTTDKNDIIKIDEDGYKTKVEDMEATPEFSCVVNVDQESTLTNVKIYYDLDYETHQLDEYKADSNHVLIANWGTSYAKAGKRLDCGKDNATLITTRTGKLVLQLKPEYFAPYNNSYTWIVIQAEDSKGNLVWRRIKVEPKQYLFNMT